MTTSIVVDNVSKTFRYQNHKTLKQVVKIAGSIDTVETILLYHVIAGKTLTSPKVIAAEGDKLTTAQGGSFHRGAGGVDRLDGAERLGQVHPAQTRQRSDGP